MPFLGQQPVEGYKTTAKQTITGDGSTSYTLDNAVTSGTDLEVFVNNVRQEPGTDYSASGNTITFTTAVESSDSCWLVYQGRATTTTTVGTDNIASGAVTAAKLSDTYLTEVADGSITATKTDFMSSNGIVIPSLSSDPGSATAGQLYYNTSDGAIKNYNGSSWDYVSNTILTSGGTITISGGYKYHTFTSSGTFTVSGGTLPNAEYLLVAGGGGGGNESGGAGAGGMITATGVAIPEGNYSIVIGAGGNGVNGSNTTAFTQTLIGGGKGGPKSTSGNSGGSGGGAGRDTTASGGSGTSGQGNSGGAGGGSVFGGSGGGGGKNAAGSNGASNGTASGEYGGNGGAGQEWPSGSGNYYAGGGGGAVATTQGTVGTGGIGGGGNGGANATGSNATANTGGGAGGSGNGGSNTQGGSGIVIVRYAI